MSDTQQNGNDNLNGEAGNTTCSYQTNIASTQLTSTGAPSLAASVQYKSCGENGRGPHLVVFCSSGGTTLHDFPCNGGTVFVNRPNLGNCSGSQRQWRNIQIVASASIPLAGSCGGLVQRPTRVIIPGGGGVVASTGCSGCGKGLGERAF
jgi:hypothetical protein